MPTALEQAEKVRKTFRAELDRARKDMGLNDEGRRQRLAVAFIAATEALGPLAAQFAAEEEKALREAEQAVFEPPPGRGDPNLVALNYRDALDRAERAGSADEAVRLLEKAEASGDELLAQAVACTAVRRAMNPFGGAGWRAIIGAYGEEHFRWRDAVETYLDRSQAPSRTETMGRQMMFSIDRPSELAGHNIDQLARQAAGQ